MQDSPILNARLKSSIPLNGVHMSFKEAIASLQRFCRPVTFYNEGCAYEMSSAGSCFLFRYCGRNLVMFTKHQLGKLDEARPLDQFCIIVDNETGTGKSAITANHFATPKFGEDYAFAEDIVFLEYQSRQRSRDISRHFVDVDLGALPSLSMVPKEQRILTFSIGYPSDLLSYDLDFDDDYAPKNVEVTHRFSRLYLSNEFAVDMELHLTMRQHERYKTLLGSLDGFSGSPVFFVFKQPDMQVRLGFAGMIRLGGNGIVHVYDAALIQRLLRQGFSGEQPLA